MIIKTAFSIWQNRIAPVFDVSATILIRETDRDALVSEKTISLPSSSALDRVSLLAENNVDILVCGAVSKDTALMLESLNIKYFPFIAGSVDDVIAACGNKCICDVKFAMPGCGRQRNRGRHQPRRPVSGCGRQNRKTDI